MAIEVAQLLEQCRQRRVRLRTAESCTAGAVAARLASVAGASDVLDRGWVVYSNRAKIEELGVEAPLLTRYGAVSREVVEAMAHHGAAKDALCVALSGVAGPGGGTAEKPVGTVWIAVAGFDRETRSHGYHFTGSRAQVQSASVDAALEMVSAMLVGNYSAHSRFS
ncbi:MAG: CinA family protein [Mariprofundales bacterium]|nr:CinA family protein [Mariprofundales bacterium]